MAEFLDAFFRFILSFGMAGILALAILDSTIFFFLPFAVDAVLIMLISQNRDSMLYYVLVTTVGSLIGCALSYMIVRKASEETIEKKFSRKKFNRVKKKVKENGFAGLLITSLLPPPFPFSPFVAAAAVTKLPAKKAFGAIVIGRTLRFLALGLLVLLPGRRLLRLLESNGFKMFMFGLFVLAAVGTALSIYKWVKK
jgi:membrane protein YqaA with SNARE-associated domain